MDNDTGKPKDKPSSPPETQSYDPDSDDTQPANTVNDVSTPFQVETQGYDGDDDHTQDIFDNIQLSDNTQEPFNDNGRLPPSEGIHIGDVSLLKSRFTASLTPDLQIRLRNPRTTFNLLMEGLSNSVAT
jgi:hypothetical protein